MRYFSVNFIWLKFQALPLKKHLNLNCRKLIDASQVSLHVMKYIYRFLTASEIYIFKSILG